MAFKSGNETSICEEALNRQINLQIKASHTYLAMGRFFAKPDVNLKNVSQFFFDNAEEEIVHINTLSQYRSERGWKARFSDDTSTSSDYDTATFTVMQAIATALTLEKDVNENLLFLYKTSQCDTHFHEFLSGSFLTDQIAAIVQMEGAIMRLSNLTSVTDGIKE